jgi:hypothetical protein
MTVDAVNRSSKLHPSPNMGAGWEPALSSGTTTAMLRRKSSSSLLNCWSCCRKLARENTGRLSGATQAVEPVFSSQTLGIRRDGARWFMLHSSSRGVRSRIRHVRQSRVVPYYPPELATG